VVCRGKVVESAQLLSFFFFFSLSLSLDRPRAVEAQPSRPPFSFLLLSLSLQLLVAHAPDEAEGPHAFSTLQAALSLSGPAVVHVSERADSRLLAFLERRGAGSGGGVAAAAAAAASGGRCSRGGGGCSPVPSFSLVLERSGLFARDAALAALSRVRVSRDDDDDDDGDGDGDFSSSCSSPPLAGRLSLDAPAQVSAAGALVSLALSSAASIPPSGGSSPPPPPFSSSSCSSNLLVLRSVAESPLPGLLSVDASALRELRVFGAEQHPGAGMLGLNGDGGGGGGGSSSSTSKEGLSVFGLVGAKCVSGAGRKVLRRWLSCPLSDVGEIEERLEAVEALVRLAGEGGGGGRRGVGFGGGGGGGRARARNDGGGGGGGDDSVVGRIQRALRHGSTSTPAALRRLAASHGLPDPKDFSIILDGIAAAVEAGEEVAEAFEDDDADDDENETAEAAIPPPLARLSAAAADPLLHSARALVSGALDVPSALAGGRLAAPGVLPALDQLSEAFDSLPERLDRVVACEASRIEEAQRRQQRRQQQQHRFGPDASSSSWSCVYMPQIGFLMAFDGEASASSSASSPSPPPPSALPGDYELAFSARTGAVMSLPPQRPAATSMLLTVGEGGRSGGGGAEEQRRRRRRRRRSGDETEAEEETLPSSAGAFYRCASTRTLDARFGDILNRIRDAEAALAAEVVKRLVSSGGGGSSSPSGPSGPAADDAAAPPPAEAMARAAAAAAEVDALCALALTARERGWSRPRVVEEPVLWLRGGERSFFIYFPRENRRMRVDKGKESIANPHRRASTKEPLEPLS